MTSKADNIEDDTPCWPIAAASRILVKAGGGSGSYCRLFHNRSTGAIELVRCDDAAAPPPRPVYDDGDADVEEEPAYRSYLATARDEGRAVEDSFHPDDVVGANLSLEYHASNPNTFHGMRAYAAAQLNVHSYPKSGRRNRREARRKRYALDSRCCEDFGDARLVVRSIRKLAGLRDAEHPLKCLVILNPFSGGGGVASKRGAMNVYRTVVKPMLEEAGAEHDALVTRRAGHASERMNARNSKGDVSANDNNHGGDRSNATTGEKEKDSVTTDGEIKDVAEYDAIVSMGGDGIQFEIFQGLRARSDGEALLSRMKFGVVGCGTYNGLAKSLLHWSGSAYGSVESMFHVCKGRTSTLDVAAYRVLAGPSPKSYVSFLSYTWGLIADVDIESECLRWLGSLREDVWAVYRGILCRRRYRARLSWLPPGKTEGLVMPEPGRPLPDGWMSFEDDFMILWVCNTSHAGYNVFSCPMAKMNDGLFHILVVR